MTSTTSEGKKIEGGADDLAQLTYLSHYARLHADGTMEQWPETIARVFSMYRTHVGPDALAAIADLVDEAQALCTAHRVFPSGRALQFARDGVEHAKIYNCWTAWAAYPRVFQEAMYLLLCGGGTGISVQRHHVAMLPPIASAADHPTKVHAVEDSIEGWADALGVLLSSYFVERQPFPAYAGSKVIFDYSRVRPKGAVIRGVGAKAPGPEPLSRALELIRKLLEGAGSTLQPIDCFDLIALFADAVLSGGIRRSATLMLFSLDDDAMATSKTGDWYRTHPHRARANISVCIGKSEATPERLAHYAGLARQFGEPGVVMVADAARTHHLGLQGQLIAGYDVGYNPCVEIGMYPAVDVPGGGPPRPTWSACNLSEINVRAVRSEEDFLAAARAAAVIGTIQASMTTLPYLGPDAEACLRREALLGVSMTGIQDNRAWSVDTPALLERGVTMIRATNDRVAAALGIQPAARLTTVKPAGTSSCVMGCASSGIHMPHAPVYIRRVQFSEGDPVLDFYRTHRPDAVTRGAWGNDWSVAVPIQLAPGIPTKADTGALALLHDVQTITRHWIRPGTVVERGVRAYLTHNISLTINVASDDEWAAVPAHIAAHADDFCGVTMLGSSGDFDYAQAPFQAIPTPAALVAEYGAAALFASGLVVHCQEEFETLHAACDALRFGVRPGARETPNHQLALDRIRRFAHKYLGGDVERTVLLLKKVDAMHYYASLTHNAHAVPWPTIRVASAEVDDALALREEQRRSTLVCAGGACTL